MAAKLRVRVTPRASKDEITGWKDGALLVRTTAPPVDGAANKACIELAAKALGVKRSQVTLIHGDKSRNKTFEIADLSDDDIKHIAGQAENKTR